MNPEKRIKFADSDIHPHLRARMYQRGVTKEEIEKVMNEGLEADDAKAGTCGKVLVFPYNRNWEGINFEEKEVRVYYKIIEGEVIVLTVKARYGKFSPEGGIKCV